MAGGYPIKPPEGLNLPHLLALSPGGIISLVGGGGKSTLMRRLALELAALGYRVITTTTTHILPDQTTGLFIMEENQAQILKEARKAIESSAIITLACGQEANGKLRGPSPAFIPELLAIADFIIIEADGAQRKPLKAPNETEPVIIPETTSVIALAGIDGVGKMARDVVFRYEIASRLTGLAADDIVTTQAVAALMAHPDGITRTSPPQSNKVAFINKVETAGQTRMAIDIATELEQHALFNHVIIGRLEGTSPSIRLIK